MELGYSMLLGEHLQAASIDYADCKNFQIVCPSCKEPVFKVHRSATLPGKHYLSHYEKDKAYVEECELRISKMRKQEVEHTNSISRGQKLEYFLSVIRDAIANEMTSGNEVRSMMLKKTAVEIIKYEGIKKLCTNAYQVMRDQTEKLPDTMDHIQIIQAQHFEPTGFAVETQKRIAVDIFQNLFTSQARLNFDFLFSFCYIPTMLSFEQAYVEEGDRLKWCKIAADCMHSLFTNNQSKIIKVLRILKETSAGSGSCRQMVEATILGDMLSRLLRLPYFELIKKAKESGKL